MDTRIIVILLTVLMASRMVKTCHQSRYQCNYQGNRALIAGDNEVGDYRTRIDSRGYCWIRIQNQSVRTIPKTDGLIHIYSPGYDTNRRRYERNKFVEYNIKCEDNEIAYMEIEDFMLNSKTCRSRCRDYVQVSGEFGILFDACGAGPPSSSYIVPADTFKVTFRSSTSFSGYFHITVLCLSGKPQSYRTRGKRRSPVQTQCGDGLINEAYHQDFMKRIKRQVGTRKIGDTLTSRRINILYGMNVTYHNKRIDFIDSKNNQIIPNMSIFNIETLYTYYLNGDVIDYNVSALGRHGICLRFSGPGPMFITSNRVYFQLFITNTTGLVPNAAEHETLKILKSDVLLDNVVQEAIANENACNPVVRAYAKSVLRRVDDRRLIALRNRCMIYDSVKTTNLLTICHPEKYTCSLMMANQTCGAVGWNTVHFPNFRNQETQAEAENELREYYPLINTNCSNCIVHFLCSVYFPFCDPNYPYFRLPPCKELCDCVYNGCNDDLQAYGFSWPEYLDCNNADKFPPNSTSGLIFCPTDVDSLTIPSIQRG